MGQRHRLFKNPLLRVDFFVIFELDNQCGAVMPVGMMGREGDTVVESECVHCGSVVLQLSYGHYNNYNIR